MDSDDSEEEQESNGEDPDLDENGDDEPSMKRMTAVNRNIRNALFSI